MAQNFSGTEIKEHEQQAVPGICLEKPPIFHCVAGEISNVGTYARLMMSHLEKAGHENLEIHPDQVIGPDVTYSLPAPNGTHVYLAAPPVGAEPGLAYIRLRSLNEPPGYDQHVYGRHKGFFTNFPWIANRLKGRPVMPLEPPISSEIPEPFEMPDIPEGHKVFLAVGELSPRRNLIELISTWSTNVGAREAILLVKVIAPTGRQQDPEDLRARIAGTRSTGLNLDKVRVFSDILDDASYARLVASIDGYISAHKTGDLDITALMAAVYGKPVIIPDGLGYRTFFDESTAILYGGNGAETILDPKEPHFNGAHWLRINTPNLAQTIVRALDNWKEAEKIGAQARKTLSKRLNPQNVLQRFCQFLERAS